MVRDTRWKYIHWQGYRPQLFDLANDPDEYSDLGANASHAPIRAQMHAKLADWYGSLKQRVTIDNPTVESKTDTHKDWGVFFGEW